MRTYSGIFLSLIIFIGIFIPNGFVYAEKFKLNEKEELRLWQSIGRKISEKEIDIMDLKIREQGSFNIIRDAIVYNTGIKLLKIPFEMTKNFLGIAVELGKIAIANDPVAYRNIFKKNYMSAGCQLPPEIRRGDMMKPLPDQQKQKKQKQEMS